MKKWLRSLSGRQIKLGISTGVSVVIFLTLTGVIALLAGRQTEQRADLRWDSEGEWRRSAASSLPMQRSPRTA